MGVCSLATNTMRKRTRALLGSLLALSAVASVNAQTTPTDYGAVLETNLDTINSIWGTVATIMIAVALVAVGVRMFRKAK